MLFNSLRFLFFYPLVTALYFLLPHRWRWALLLGASSYFYMAFVPVYILILAFTIVVNYGAGIATERASGPRRRALLVVSIVVNLGVLAFFKYYAFTNANLEALAQALHLRYPLPVLHILLPIGLSFHTFQSMAYAVEVYRGNQTAERHLGIFALYVMFYPQLVAGPIERPQNLLPQLRAVHRFDEAQLTAGLRRMLWGFFKKVVIADRLAVLVNEVFGQLHFYSGASLILAMVLFAFQVYCDFSGYSDIAIGSAQTMGFELKTNFDRPYFATSIADFWRRWHISLSTFFRDYVYIPMGGSRVSRVRVYRNLLITFALSGLWHGARWTFIVWGVLHGLFMIAGDLTARLRLPSLGGVGRLVSIVTTFALVTIAWVFFRATTVDDALSMIFRSFETTRGLASAGRMLGRPSSELVLALSAIVLLCAAEAFGKRFSFARVPAAARFFAYALAALAILDLGVVEDIPFIYFQF